MKPAEVPASATRLPRKSATTNRPPPRIRTILPHPERTEDVWKASNNTPLSPTRNATLNLLPGILMSSVPTAASTTSSKKKNDKTPLMSAKDPLSIPIMSVNFRRFVSKIGPIFWLQDRVEEIMMWRKGWKVTTTWMAAYTFLCYFPRMLFLLPQFAVLGIILATYKYSPLTPIASLLDLPSDPDVESVPVEGSVDWQGNIQAIQNLMGTFSDGYDAVYPFVLHITHRTSYTPHILTFLVLSLIPGIALVTLPYLPIRLVFLTVGLAPFVITNPYTQQWILTTKKLLQKDTDLRWLRMKFGLDTKLPLVTFAQRFLDDNNLTDACWTAEKKEVELFENERAVARAPGGGEGDTKEGVWSKSNLVIDERHAWTRTQDGVNDNSLSSSNLTFSLDQGWEFVDTEDWRLDVDASWNSLGGDRNGWVYTNTSWLDPLPYCHDGAFTRRRRWTRRIWFKQSST